MSSHRACTVVRVPQRQHTSSGLVEQLELSVPVTENFILSLNSSSKRLQKVMHFRNCNFHVDSNWVKMREALLQGQDMIHVCSRALAKEG